MGRAVRRRRVVAGPALAGCLLVVAPLLVSCGGHQATSAAKADCPAVRGDLRARKQTRDDAGHAYEQARVRSIAAHGAVAVQSDLGDRAESDGGLEDLRRSFLTARVTYDETFTLHPACYQADEVGLAQQDRAAAVRYLGGEQALARPDPTATAAS